ILRSCPSSRSPLRADEDPTHTPSKIAIKHDLAINLLILPPSKVRREATSSRLRNCEGRNKFVRTSLGSQRSQSSFGGGQAFHDPLGYQCLRNAGHFKKCLDCGTNARTAGNDRVGLPLDTRGVARKPCRCG